MDAAPSSRISIRRLVVGVVGGLAVAAAAGAADPAAFVARAGAEWLDERNRGLACGW